MVGDNDIREDPENYAESRVSGNRGPNYTPSANPVPTRSASQPRPKKLTPKRSSLISEYLTGVALNDLKKYGGMGTGQELWQRELLDRLNNTAWRHGVVTSTDLSSWLKKDDLAKLVRKLEKGIEKADPSQSCKNTNEKILVSEAVTVKAVSSPIQGPRKRNKRPAPGNAQLQPAAKKRQSEADYSVDNLTHQPKASSDKQTPEHDSQSMPVAAPDCPQQLQLHEVSGAAAPPQHQDRSSKSQLTMHNLPSSSAVGSPSASSSRMEQEQTPVEMQRRSNNIRAAYAKPSGQDALRSMNNHLDQLKSLMQSVLRSGASQSTDGYISSLGG